MSQQKKTSYEKRVARRRVLVGIMAAVLALLMFGVVLLSALMPRAVTKSQVDALKKQAAEATARKDEAKKKLASINADLSKLEQQIALLDQQIEAQEDEIAAQEALLEELTKLIDEKTIELAESEAEQERQYGTMRERIRYMAEHGTTSYLSILLSSDSFSDFLNRYEIIKQISLRDEKLFEKLKAIRDRVASEKLELEETKKEEEETRAVMEQNKLELEAQRAEKIRQQQAAMDAKNAANKAYAEMIEKEEKLLAEYKKAAAELAAQSTYVGGTFMWPLPAANNVITCPYGMRKHPITGVRKLHTGIDLRASTGTKVYAANSGTVTTSGYSSAWGNYIIISHGGGLTTLYAHLSRRSVSKGNKVKRGDIIGYTGNTGYSTGPHLHFEIDKNGTPYDPLTEFKGFSVTYS